MSENKTVPFTEFILTGKGPVIKVEMKLDDAKKLLMNQEAFIALIDVDGLNYLVPKAVIKALRSDDKQRN